MNLNLANNIRKLREAKGLTQADLAGKAGIATRVIQRIESGKSNTKIGTLRSVASALGAILSIGVHDANPPDSNTPIKTTLSPFEDPQWEELSDVVNAYRRPVAPELRLLALYILTFEEAYLAAYAAIPAAPKIASIIKKVLAKP